MTDSIKAEEEGDVTKRRRHVKCVTDHNPNLDVSTLLPKKNPGKSLVWEYFGFRRDPNFDGEPLDKEVPTCLLCKKDVVSRGRYRGFRGRSFCLFVFERVHVCIVYVMACTYALCTWVMKKHACYVKHRKECGFTTHQRSDINQTITTAMCVSFTYSLWWAFEYPVPR